MQDWPCSLNLKSLCGFLGLTGYYRKFSWNYGKIANPPNALLKNNACTWIPAVDHSFQALKYFMCSTPVLALPYFTNTFVLECDASGKGIGDVLMQDGRPLDFTSKNRSERHLGQSIYEKEMLFILHDVDIWHPYLLGQCFQIKIDHRSQVFSGKMRCITRETKMGDQVIFLWLWDHLQEWKVNVVMDALSRKYEEYGAPFSLSFIVPDWLQAIHWEWLQDPKISRKLPIISC